MSDNKVVMLVEVRLSNVNLFFLNIDFKYKIVHLDSRTC